MVIDVHTHTFPDKIASVAIRTLKGKSHTKAFTDGTNDGLILSMHNSGVDYSIVQPVATSAHQVEHINDSAIKINSQAKLTGLYSFGAMHPDFEDYEKELARLKNFGIMGIKLHPVYQECDIDDAKYIKILKCCEKLGLCVLIHAGWDISYPGIANAMPDKIARALDKSGASKIILAHMGGWQCNKQVLEILKDSGAYFDTAFSFGTITPDPEDDFYNTHALPELPDHEKFYELIQNLGVEKVLFGTDSPWFSQKYSVEFIKSLGLNENELNQIFSGNIKNLLGI